MRRTFLIPVFAALPLLACDHSASTQSPAPTPDTASPDPGTPAAETPSAEPDEPPAAATDKAVGASCLAADECASGVCEGEGCGDDTPGTCADAKRMCTRDAVQYCGCDGEMFVGSGSCPGKRYASIGACGGDGGPDRETL